MESQVLYTSSGLKLNRSEIIKRPVVGDGAESIVYQYDEDKVIKLFNSVGTSSDYNTMMTIKNLRLPNFYHSYDLVSPNREGSKKYAGNISRYYQSEEIDVLEMPTEWLLKNYYGLREAAIKLGENRILIFDSGIHNAIVNNEGITMIDADLYTKHSYICVKENLESLNLELFYDLFYKGYTSFHEIEDEEAFNDALDGLFFEDIESGKTKNFVKILSRYSKPIEYFNEHI